MRKRNPLNKNQGWEPIQQKYNASENTSRHNLKRKQKQTINKNRVKTLWKEDS
jgi:YD repeat-containing protein